jgi:hypothetical protein
VPRLILACRNGPRRAPVQTTLCQPPAIRCALNQAVHWLLPRAVHHPAKRLGSAGSMVVDRRPAALGQVATLRPTRTGSASSTEVPASSSAKRWGARPPLPRKGSAASMVVTPVPCAGTPAALPKHKQGSSAKGENPNYLLIPHLPPNPKPQTLIIRLRLIIPLPQNKPMSLTTAGMEGAPRRCATIRNAPRKQRQEASATRTAAVRWLYA